MPETIEFAINVAVSEGPKVVAAQTVTVDAYDKLEVILDAGDTPTLQLQPVADKVTLLLVTASKYDAALRYDLGNGEKGLEAPLFLVGLGNVSQTGDGTQLKLNNTLAEPVTVEVLVGRAAN